MHPTYIVTTDGNAAYLEKVRQQKLQERLEEFFRYDESSPVPTSPLTMSSVERASVQSLKAHLVNYHRFTSFTMFKYFGHRDGELVSTSQAKQRMVQYIKSRLATKKHFDAIGGRLVYSKAVI